MFAAETHMSAEPAHRSWRKSFLVHARDWLRTCADSYAAARSYEELRHLSNAELNSRGLSRATLAADLLRSHERD
jgi:hypothetical protein